MTSDATRRTALVWPLAVLLVLAVQGSAAAQTPRDEFLHAMQALRQGDAERAAVLFARVYDRAKVPIALYGLGLALRRLGRSEQAARAFEGYIARADPRRFGKRIERAQAMLRELRPHDPPARCALGSACFGPVLSVGVPRLFGLGVQLRASRHVGLAAELRLSPALDYGVVELGGRSVDLALHLHPFGNAFFLTAGVSFEHLVGQATYRAVRVEGEADSIALLFGGGLAGSSGVIAGFDTHFVLDVSRSPIELRTLDGSVPAGVDPQLALERVTQELDQRRGSPPLIFQANLRLGYLF
jgi:hypothetical protein